MMNHRLLIVEDDPGLQKQMRWCFDGYDVHIAGNLRDAEHILRKEEPQVITLDLGLPPDPGGTTAGLDCLSLIHHLLPASKVIVITGREEQDVAIAAIARGADDFYQKPIEAETLRFVVEQAFKLWHLEEENRRLSREAPAIALAGLVTAHTGMLELCRQVERIAPTDINVMILGETGTGKEVIANNLHLLSNRREHPFVAINCAAIPETLLENELFGHERGAFTGANARKTGRIEAANGGTLFLDEIGDMPLSLQAKILRFLQERTFERVGGTAAIQADVRVLAATHNDLQQMISEGRFREDLYYRLSEISLTLPSLCERGDDAVLIATHLLNSETEGRVHLSMEAQEAIRDHTWPGNIRELQNRIKRAAILCEGRQIAPEDLELSERTEGEALALNLKAVRAEAERQAISRALSNSSGNISQAARLLGVSRPTLYNLLDKHAIGPETA